VSRAGQVGETGQRRREKTRSEATTDCIGSNDRSDGRSLGGQLREIADNAHLRERIAGSKKGCREKLDANPASGLSAQSEKRKNRKVQRLGGTARRKLQALRDKTTHRLLSGPVTRKEGAGSGDFHTSGGTVGQAEFGWATRFESTKGLKDAG